MSITSAAQINMKAVSAPLIVAAAAAGAVAVADASSAQATAGMARYPAAPPIPIANDVRSFRLMIAFSAAVNLNTMSETLPIPSPPIGGPVQVARDRGAMVTRRVEERVGIRKR